MASREPLLPPAPLVVGVTGHRDLRDDDVPTLEALLADVFSALRRRYPETLLILLTPLAEGADRLAARVALRFRAEEPSKIRLVAPLPMPRALYEQDFLARDDPGRASLQEFEDLLARVDDWFEMPIPAQYTEQDIRAHGTPRDKQYEQVGAFIAAHCQVLLALWDGVPTEKIGGTGRIIRYVLDGLPPQYAPLRGPIDQLELGPVYHIVTPRRSSASIPDRALTIRYLFPSRFGEETIEDAARSAERLYDRIFRRIETFNRDVRARGARLVNELQRSRRSAFEPRTAAGLPDDVQFLLTCYAEADALAVVYRMKTDAARFRLFLLTFLTSLSFGAYAHLGHWPPALLIYVALLGLTVSVYVWAAPIDDPYGLLKKVLGEDTARACWARRGDFQNKAQDYRALAEGLRVQLFWRLAGVPDAVADHYMLKQKSELDWIRIVLRNWTLLAERRARASPPGDAATRRARLQLVLERWVRDQGAYYQKAADRDRRELVRHTRRAKWALAVGTLSAVMLAGSLNFPVPWQHLLLAWLGPGAALVPGAVMGGHGVLITGILMLLVTAALLYAYANEKALEDHVKQYRRMTVVFSDAGKRLSRMLEDGTCDSAQRMILYLGREALVENGDWVILHRSRPLEIHTG